MCVYAAFVRAPHDACAEEGARHNMVALALALALLPECNWVRLAQISMGVLVALSNRVLQQSVVII